MTKKQIKKLAMASYKRNVLDEKLVNRISKHLTRSELNEYIKAIKNFENTKRITIFTPVVSAGEFLKSQLRKLFPNKNIFVKEDKSLIAGVKVTDNDNVYDFNLRNNLKNLVSYINQQ